MSWAYRKLTLELIGMKKFYVLAFAVLTAVFPTSCQKDFDPNYPADDIEYDSSRRILVAYFSQTGNTERLANQIVEATGADVCRIQPSEPYACNPYDDSDRIQNESYNNLRPGVANLPDNVEDYDVILVGSPIWWHNPAMVVCTFLESYDLSEKNHRPVLYLRFDRISTAVHRQNTRSN